MEDPFIVNIEKVGIKCRLQYTRQHRNQLRRLAIAPSVDPVEDVEGAVQTQAQEVVGGDGFGFTSFLQLEHLRQNGDRLQQD